MWRIKAVTLFHSILGHDDVIMGNFALQPKFPRKKFLGTKFPGDETSAIHFKYSDWI